MMYKLNPELLTYTMPKRPAPQEDPGGYPRFSVMIPVYNAEKVLHRSIGSVLNQRYGNFELLLCDDKSTDGSLQILREYEKRDARIKVLCHDSNQGSLIGRNTLIRAAAGDYLIWMDSDDEIAPDFLSHAASALRREKFDILEYPAFFYDENGGPNYILTKEDRIVRQDNLGEFFLSDWRALRWNMWCKVIRAEVMKKSMPPDTRYCADDIFFMLPVFHHASSYCFISKIHPMYKWYTGNGTWSGALKKMNPAYFEERCRMRHDSVVFNVDFIRSHNLPEERIPYFLTEMCDLHDMPHIINSAPPERRQEYMQIFLKYFCKDGGLVNGYPLPVPPEFLLKKL